MDMSLEAALAENRTLRRLLLRAHGNMGHGLYLDDGEWSCNSCMIDFRKDSADLIEHKTNRYVRLRDSAMASVAASPLNLIAFAKEAEHRAEALASLLASQQRIESLLTAPVAKTRRSVREGWVERRRRGAPVITLKRRAHHGPK